MLESGGHPGAPVDLARFSLIHVLGYDHDWHRWFRRHASDSMEVPRGLSVDGSLIAIEAALRGDGIMLGRRPFIDHHLRSGELVEIFDQDYVLHADYYLRQSSPHLTRRASREVADWLKSLVPA